MPISSTRPSAKSTGRARLPRFSGEDTRVTVHRANTEKLRQPGWDIEVTLRDGQGEQVFYWEAKTYTPRSQVRSLLPLSDTQMQLAASLGRTMCCW